VEYATREQAQNAVQTLSNRDLMGRLVYVREDREAEPRFGTAPGVRPSFGGPPGGGFGGPGFGGAGAGGGARQIYVSNLPFNVGWQDLKDLFRQAGAVARADVQMGHDGRPKGSGIVAFETPEDARAAINQFNGCDWNGRVLEVREDRFAGAAPYGGGFRGGYGGGMRGGFGARGGFNPMRGGFGGYGARGGFGGPGGYHAGGPPGGYHASSAPQAAPNEFTDGATGGGDRSATIFVRNLPWSTSNDDLVELFTTIGKVERAEIQYEPSGRSRGTGVVSFDNAESAETAINKFTGYEYGGRPLGLSYVKYFSQQAAPDHGPLDQNNDTSMGGDQVL